MREGVAGANDVRRRWRGWGAPRDADSEIDSGCRSGRGQGGEAIACKASFPLSRYVVQVSEASCPAFTSAIWAHSSRHVDLLCPLSQTHSLTLSRHLRVVPRHRSARSCLPDLYKACPCRQGPVPHVKARTDDCLTILRDKRDTRLPMDFPEGGFWQLQWKVAQGGEDWADWVEKVPALQKEAVLGGLLPGTKVRQCGREHGAQAMLLWRPQRHKLNMLLIWETLDSRNDSLSSARRLSPSNASRVAILSSLTFPFPVMPPPCNSPSPSPSHGFLRSPSPRCLEPLFL